MKKLIIAAAVACAAVFANAASCDWAVTWGYAVNTDNPTYDGSEVLSGTYWVIALDGASTEGISVNDSGEITLGAGMSIIDNNSVSVSDPSGTITGLSETDNGKYLALVIFDENYKYYGVSDVAQYTGIKDVPPSNAEAITFSNIYDATDDDNYFVANVKATGGEVIPEPSSALLLLLGMAGIALRRKQA